MMEEDEYKEVYAMFGLAMYKVQVLEHAIVNALVLLELIPQHLENTPTVEEWSSKIDSYMDSLFDQTLGKLLKKLTDRQKSNEVLIKKLQECKIRRNFLAHHFFREKALHWLTAYHRNEMLRELDKDCDLLTLTTNMIDELLEPLYNKYGYTYELRQAELIQLKKSILTEV